MDTEATPATGDQRLVFVSHSGTDTWVARQIARAITECGAQAFLDEADISVGDDFEDEIFAFLAKTDELVVLLTPWALDRPWVWAEIAAARVRRIPIVGFLLGLSATELQGSPRAHPILKERNLVPLNDIERYLEELRARVRSHQEATT